MEFYLAPKQAKIIKTGLVTLIKFLNHSVSVNLLHNKSLQISGLKQQTFYVVHYFASWQFSLDSWVFL